MRRIIIGTFAFALLFTSCKTMQRMKSNEAAAPAQQEQTQTKVFSVAEPQAAPTQAATAEQPKTTTTYQAPIKPVRTQTETFTFDQKDDAAKYNGSTFFVIIGSFSRNNFV